MATSNHPRFISSRKIFTRRWDEAAGSLFVDGKTIIVGTPEDGTDGTDGSAWFEHQWGNYRSGCNAFNYDWMSLRLDKNGSASGADIMVRDWHTQVSKPKPGGAVVPVSIPKVARLVQFPRNDKTPPTYAQGVGAFNLIENDWYPFPTEATSELTFGTEYNLILVEDGVTTALQPPGFNSEPTSKGDFAGYRLEAMFDDQVQTGITSSVHYWEGGAWVYTLFKVPDSNPPVYVVGDRVGKAFVEQSYRFK